MLAARYRLDPIANDWESAVAELTERNAVERLWALDHTLFQEDPADAANRMGWLRVPDFSRRLWPELAAAAAVIAEENDHIVLMGMGGSSLFPEVLSQTFGPAAGYPTMHVLDTTDPAAIAAVVAECPPDRTFCVAASKSGSTLETRSHLELFWTRSGDPSHFAVITDLGSALGDLACDRGFRHVWENDPDIGGRYSALSLFGIVPAALLGLDGTLLLDAADEMAESLQPTDDEADLNLGLALGAAIGAAAKGGRDKLTIFIDGRVATFGLWLEQLVAESLGKHGVGVVPIVDEPADIALTHPDDRLIVVVGDAPGAADVAASGIPSITLTLEEPTDIGAHVMLWEFAIAMAGRVLGINPFDQPDVEAAKAAARALLKSGAPSEPPQTAAADALGSVRPGDYLAICAFVDPTSVVTSRLVDLRIELGRRLGVATTLGIGPRFLHSTGQLHKGGPHDAVFVQVVGDDPDDLAIPNQSFTFGQFKHAQAAGDLQALRDAGQTRAYRVAVDDLLDS